VQKFLDGQVGTKNIGPDMYPNPNPDDLKGLMVDILRS
jgi:hypothetical protein